MAKKSKLVVPKTELILPNINVAVVGPPKTLKSTLALTFPEPIAIFAFDVAGVKRALRYARKDLRYEIFEYNIPLFKTAPDQFSWALEKWKQFYEVDLPDVAESGLYNTIDLDTGSMMYDLCRYAYREERGFEKINRRNYEEVYARMSGVLMIPQYHPVNMVSTYYWKEEYKADQPTGRDIIDSYRKTEGIVDMVIETNLRQNNVEGKIVNVPYAVISASGFNYELNGLELTKPTYDDIITLMFPESEVKDG